MSDQDTTRQLPSPDPPPREPKRLLRSSDDRVIAGVCAGLGRYFGIDPVIVRIAFAHSSSRSR
jgi:PspC domain